MPEFIVTPQVRKMEPSLALADGLAETLRAAQLSIPGDAEPPGSPGPPPC